MQVAWLHATSAVYPINCMYVRTAYWQYLRCNPPHARSWRSASCLIHYTSTTYWSRDLQSDSNAAMMTPAVYSPRHKHNLSSCSSLRQGSIAVHHRANLANVKRAGPVAIGQQHEQLKRHES